MEKSRLEGWVFWGALLLVYATIFSIIYFGWFRLLTLTIVALTPQAGATSTVVATYACTQANQCAVSYPAIGRVWSLLTPAYWISATEAVIFVSLAAFGLLSRKNVLFNTILVFVLVLGVEMWFYSL